MAIEKLISTRIVLTHDEYSALKDKTLKAGEVVLAKVGTTEANGKVTQPIWMMKVGDGESTVASCPWLVAPAADVYEWAKKSSLAVEDVPTLPIAKIEGLESTLAGKADEEHTHTASEVTDFESTVKSIVTDMGIAGDEEVADIAERLETAEGEIDALQIAVTETIPADIAKKVAQSDYDTKVAALEKADTDEAAAREALDRRVQTLEGIDHSVYAKTSDVNTALDAKADAATTYSKTDVDGLIAPLATKEELNGVKATAEQGVADAATAQAAAAAAQADIDAFFSAAETGEAALDTLKEIQDFLSSDEGTVQTLLDDVAGLKEADVTLQGNIDKKADQTVVDGIEDRVEALEGTKDAYIAADTTLKTELQKEIDDDVKAAIDAEVARANAAYDVAGAADGALEAAKADTAAQIEALKLADTYAAKSHTHVVADITDYATDVATKIKVETDARTEAVEDLQGQIDGVKATADAAVKGVTTDAATGLKVTTTDGVANISFLDDVVFVLNGGTADNLN